MKFRPKLMAYSMNGMPRRSLEEACRVMIHNFPEVTTVPLPTLSAYFISIKSGILSLPTLLINLRIALSFISHIQMN